MAMLEQMNVRVTEWTKVRENTIRTLREIADYLDTVYQRTNKAKAEFSNSEITFIVII